MPKNKHLTKQQVERLSRKNAKAIVGGYDKLRSWGKSGWFKSKRLNRYYYFRSMIEANVLKLLDESEDQIVDFDTEKFYIPYQFKGATLNYCPDIILRTKSNKVYVVEVKPEAQLTEEKNLAKWAEAREWCWRQGVRFFVITEKDYPKLIEILQAFDSDDVTKAQMLMEWKMV